MPAIPIVRLTSISQVSELVTHMVPKIWTGSTFLSSQRSNAFRLFCQNVMKATQVSNSCVLVALYYIYRLRFAYPSIKGSIGSEIRLFTTALILANKFLDDNTFTNKTWSEVSSVPLYELNIMEMEFLTALEYKICIQQAQFYSWASQCQQWLSQLLTQSILIPTMPSVSIPTLNDSSAYGNRASHKRSSDYHLSGHKTKRRVVMQHHPYYQPPTINMCDTPALTRSSSSTTTSSSSLSNYYHHYHNHSTTNSATSIAAFAAATAMNVNYPNYTSRH
ncbi:cyclin-domain-containing protein [Mycotypha africana]|uniref:cyclin-domain-containing protein n=1 Tax=Mycotypha africana TaxID=64632 RepID=UPI00230097FC|nr:cyclin-domain-containing protein [Mycotypha africana]KAI8971560.1 cyclin-domain-containing protein [Mycotypha africana]